MKVKTTMTLPTGMWARNNPFQSFFRYLRQRLGFTFIEMMVTTAILAFGLVLIYKTYFLSLDYIRHVTYRLYALNLLNNRIVMLQENFEVRGEIPFAQKQEIRSFLIDNKNIDFHYLMDFRNVEYLNSIVELNLVLFWKERDRNITLSQPAYIASYKSKIEYP